MKKFFLSLLLCAALFTAALPVAFAAGGTVTLTPRQDSAGVTVNLPQGTDTGVTSLRLSFQVQLTGGDADKTGAQFSFDDALPGSVHEYRYDPQTGRLNLYVAGRDALFADGSVHLGSVVLATGDAQGAAATVSVVADSLELANAAHGTQTPGVDTSAVDLAVGSGGQAPAPDSSSSSSSSSSDDSSSSSGGGAVSQPAAPAGGASSGAPVRPTGTQTSASSSSSSSAPDSDVSSSSSAAPSDASSDAPASSSQSQTAQQENAAASTWLYIVAGVLALAVLATALFLFLRRK